MHIIRKLNNVTDNRQYGMLLWKERTFHESKDFEDSERLAEENMEKCVRVEARVSSNRGTNS